jgi:hypothetical protein
MKKTWGAAKEKVEHLPKIQNSASQGTIKTDSPAVVDANTNSDEQAKTEISAMTKYVANIYDPLQETTQGWIIRNPRPVGTIEGQLFVDYMDIVHLSVANVHAGRKRNFDAHKAMLKAGVKMKGFIHGGMRN